MGFHSLNASILKKSDVFSPSTKETRSSPQCSPIRLQESFWNLEMKNSILICTASSLEVRCNSLRVQDQILNYPCQFFPNSFPILFKSSSKTLDIGSKSRQLPQTTQDSVLFLSSEQGGSVNNSPMLKAAGNSALLTFSDSDFASCEETRRGSLKPAFSFVSR